jgi:hypothetical protein
MPDRAQLDHDGAREIIDIAELAIEARRDRRQETPQIAFAVLSSAGSSSSIAVSTTSPLVP